MVVDRPCGPVMSYRPETSLYRWVMYILSPAVRPVSAHCVKRLFTNVNLLFLWFLLNFINPRCNLWGIFCSFCVNHTANRKQNDPKHNTTLQLAAQIQSRSSSGWRSCIKSVCVCVSPVCKHPLAAVHTRLIEATAAEPPFIFSKVT